MERPIDSTSRTVSYAGDPRIRLRYYKEVLEGVDFVWDRAEIKLTTIKNDKGETIRNMYDELKEAIKFVDEVIKK